MSCPNVWLKPAEKSPVKLFSNFIQKYFFPECWIMQNEKQLKKHKTIDQDDLAIVCCW